MSLSRRMFHFRILAFLPFGLGWIGWGGAYGKDGFVENRTNDDSQKYASCMIRVQQKRSETTIQAELDADGRASIHVNNRRYRWDPTAISKAMNRLRSLGFFESKDRKVALPWNVNALNRPWLEASYHLQDSEDLAPQVLVESDKWTPEMARFVKQFETEVNTALKGQSGEALEDADEDGEPPASVAVNAEAVVRRWKGLVAREFGKTVDEYEGEWEIPYLSMEFIFVELSSFDETKQTGFDPFGMFRDSFEGQQGDLRCSTVEKELHMWAKRSAEEMSETLENE